MPNTVNKLNSGNQNLIYLLCNGRRILSLFDTGSTCSLANRELFDESLLVIEDHNGKVTAANGANMKVLGTANVVISVAGWTTGHDILIVDNLDSNSLVLGTDFMKKHHIVIDFANEQVCIDDKVKVEYIYARETRVPTQVKQEEGGTHTFLTQNGAMMIRDGQDDNLDAGINKKAGNNHAVQSYPMRFMSLGDTLKQSGSRSHCNGTRGAPVVKTGNAILPGESVDTYTVDDHNNMANIKELQCSHEGETRDNQLVNNLKCTRHGSFGKGKEGSLGIGQNAHEVDGCDWECENEVVFLHNVSNAANIKAKSSNSVIIKQDSCIQPHSSTYVQVDFSCTDTQDLYLFEPNRKAEIKFGILMDCGIMDENCKYIRVENHDDMVVNMMHGMNVGSVCKIENIQEYECESNFKFDRKLFDINPKANKRDVRDLWKILVEYQDVFAIDNKELGCTDLVQHSIDTGDAPPIRQKMWNRYSPEEHALIAEQVNEMLEAGVIARAYSPWCANVVLAPKKGTTKLRFCTDYRALNSVTKTAAYYIPRIDDLIDSLRGSKVFHCLDALSGYWQIRLNEEDGSDIKTVFITREGVFIYKRLPFGLKNAPMEFCLLMDRIFADVRDKVAIYIDDITPHGIDGRTANENLAMVLQRLRNAKLKLKISKCKFLYSRIEILGFVIDQKGVSPDPQKVEAIVIMPPPKTVTQMRSFLGMVNFYRKFIPQLAFTAKPLYEMLETGKATAWSGRQTQAFEELKSKIAKAPALTHYDPLKELEIQCDANNYAVAGVLLQVWFRETDENRKRRMELPLQYASRT